MLAAPGLIPRAAADPYHMQIENADDNGGTDELSDKSWIAQSFVAEEAFTITRVAILAEANSGASRVIASLRDDDPASPTPSPTPIDITSGIGDGLSSQSWVNVSFDDWVDLRDNTTYWVVARSNTQQGYDWYHSPGDSAYPNGTGVNSSDGSTWFPRDKDYTFQVYGFYRPNMSYDVVPSVSALEPGDVEELRIEFNNSGPGDADYLWVNVTLPDELTYVGDDAGSIGGVRSCCQNYEFTNVTPGLYSFNLTFEVKGGVPDGTLAVVNFSFESVDHVDYRPPTQSEQVSLTIFSGYLDATLSPSTLLPDPGDIIQMDLTIENLGNGSALGVLVNAQLDSDVSYLSSTPTGSYDDIAHTLTWSFPTIGPASSTTISWMLEVDKDAPDGTVVACDVQASYTDSSGTDFPPVQTSAESTVVAPSFAPFLQADVDTVERGDEVVATVYYNNTGSVPAPEAWMNWSLGGNYEVLELTPSLPYTQSSDGIDVMLADVGVGPHFLAVRLQTLGGMSDGQDMGILVTWEATDGNGNAQPTVILQAPVTLDAPNPVLEIETSATKLEVGRILVLNVTLSNVGKAAATGWLNLTMPSGFEYLGTDNSLYAATVHDDLISWRVTSLGPESGVDLGIRLRLLADVGPTSIQVKLVYSDGKGSQPETVSSNTVFIEPIPVGPSTLDLVVWALIAPLLLAGGLFVAWRWMRAKRFSIEEVFVIHSDGILLAHRSKTLTPDKDRDILVAMFKAVQDFIREAFSSREDTPVRSLTFGDSKVLIERGMNHHVALVYRGEDDGTLSARLSRLSRRIDDEFGQVLEVWSGDMDEVRGVRDLLPTLWGLGSDGPDDQPLARESDTMKGSIRAAWERFRNAVLKVLDRLRGAPAIDDGEIETSVDGGWD